LEREEEKSSYSSNFLFEEEIVKVRKKVVKEPLIRKEKGNEMNKKSMTLIELLVALSITVVIGLGVYRVLCSGISLWRWHTEHRSLGEVVIFWEKISYDLRNYCPLTLPDFKGTLNSISFFVHNPGYLLQEDSSLKMGKDLSIYKVEYIFLPYKKEIRRRLYNFGSEKPFRETVVANNIEKLNFTFYLWDEKSKREIVSLNIEEAPQSVGIEVEWDEFYGRKGKKRRTFLVPLIQLGGDKTSKSLSFLESHQRLSLQKIL